MNDLNPDTQIYPQSYPLVRLTLNRLRDLIDGIGLLNNPSDKPLTLEQVQEAFIINQNPLVVTLFWYLLYQNPECRHFDEVGLDRVSNQILLMQTPDSHICAMGFAQTDIPYFLQAMDESIALVPANTPFVLSAAHSAMLNLADDDGNLIRDPAKRLMKVNFKSYIDEVVADHNSRYLERLCAQSNLVCYRIFKQMLDIIHTSHSHWLVLTNKDDKVTFYDLFYLLRADNSNTRHIYEALSLLFWYLLYQDPLYHDYSILFYSQVNESYVLCTGGFDAERNPTNPDICWWGFDKRYLGYFNSVIKQKMASIAPDDPNYLLLLIKHIQSRFDETGALIVPS